MDKKLLKISLRNVTLAAVYILGVSQLMYHGEVLFGARDNSFMPFAILLLFSLSAAVIGGLIFGKAIMLYLDGKKSDGVRVAIYSVLWLAIYTLIAIILLIALRGGSSDLPIYDPDL